MPTQKEIAEKLGLSQITVSRALSQSELVRPETRERVLAALRDAGYSINKHARNLALGRVGAIAALVPGVRAMRSIYFLQTFEAISSRLYAMGKDLRFGAFAEGADIAADFEPQTYEVEGVILFNMALAPDILARAVAFFQENRKRFVLIQSYKPEKPWPYVSVDNFAGGRAAAEHLLALGHKRLACVWRRHTPGGELDGEYKERVDGFKRAALDSGDPNVSMTFHDLDADASGFIREFAAMSPDHRPTGVFSLNDRYARILVYKFAAIGVSVPDDVSLIGFNDDPAYTEMEKPFLTTIRQPFYELGARAVEIVTAPEGQKIEGATIAPPLIERDSCAPRGTRTP